MYAQLKISTAVLLPDSTRTAFQLKFPSPKQAYDYEIGQLEFQLSQRWESEMNGNMKCSTVGLQCAHVFTLVIINMGLGVNKLKSVSVMQHKLIFTVKGISECQNMLGHTGWCVFSQLMFELN